MPFEVKTFKSHTYVDKVDESGAVVKDEKGNPVSVRVCVGEVQVPEFSPDDAGLQDILSYYGKDGKEPRGGVAFLVNTFNTQNITNARNKIRAEATKGPSQESLQTEAMGRITAQAPDGPLFKELLSCAGDGGRVQALVARVAKEIEAEYMARRSANFKPAKAGEGDDE